MIRKHIFKDKSDKNSIRWRLHEPTRLEAFSDAVFAFALTLVVIALEVPETFDELAHLMMGFFAFAVCFLLVALIWHDQYVFFRRTGLQDTRTNVLNLMLLFMVIYFVYPLKFLFYSFSEGFAHRFHSDGQVCQLMIIYGVGYFVIYSLMALMYKHALKRKEDLMFSPLEVYNMKSYIYSYFARLGVVVLSLLIAIYGLDKGGSYSFFSGITYSLMGFVIPFVHKKRGKKIEKLFTKEEIDEVINEIVVVEAKEN